MRILVNTAALLSFLLFVASVANWARSQWATDWLIYRRLVGPVEDLRMRRLSLFGTQGSLILEVGTHRFRPVNADEAETLRRDLPTDMGFSYLRWDPRPVEECFNSTPRWGFAFETLDSSMERPGLRTFERVRNIEHVILYHTTYAALPWWLLALLFAFAPSLVAWRRWRSRAFAAGRCAACGYDLRATPDRCPECGTVPGEGRAPAPEGGRR